MICRLKINFIFRKKKGRKKPWQGDLSTFWGGGNPCQLDIYLEITLVTSDLNIKIKRILFERYSMISDNDDHFY